MNHNINKKSPQNSVMPEHHKKAEKRIEIAIYLIILLTLFFFLLWLTNIGDNLLNFVKSADLWEKVSPNFVITVIILTSICVVISLIIIKNKKPKPKASNITKILLLDSLGNVTKEWDIKDKTAVIIGKSCKLNQSVDIDLVDEEYAAMISPQHAVLNLSDGKWFIEDLSLKNGTGVKRKNTGIIHRVDNERFYILEPEDMIYLAKTRLLIK